MLNSNKKGMSFRGVLKLIKVACVATMFLAISSQVFAASSPIEGVWGIFVTSALGLKEVAPASTIDNSKLHTYWCFYDGKYYVANKVTESKNPSEDGLYKGNGEWGVSYAFIDNTLIMGEVSSSFVITGDTAKLSMGMVEIVFRKVKSPTAKEITALTKVLPRKKQARQ